MGLMLPNELIWIMDKLGFSWPDVDEDEVVRGAELLRNFGNDLESVIQAIDRTMVGSVSGAMQGQVGPSTSSAWSATRSQNLQKLIDLMGPASIGMDVGAVVIVGLKAKVIADVTSTVFTLMAMLSNPFTAAGSGLMLAAKKKLLDIAVDIAVEQLINQVTPMVLEPMLEHIPGVISAILSAPMVEGAIGDTGEFHADLAALEDAQGQLRVHGGDIQTITATFFTDFSSLNFGGA